MNFNDRELYPEIEPYKSNTLKVSDIHTLYYEEVGNPEGQPVVLLHGGPGGGCTSDYRRFFDPAHYRVILFDQRGAGRSTPHAELKENTTWDLVSDIEKLREKLQIEKWVVFGGSWGSTLSLIYAINHSDRVQALCLRGIFLCRPKELQWFYQEGASKLFPDVWESYKKHIPVEERSDFISAYYKRLTSDDKTIRLEAAKRWSVWEGKTSNLVPKEDAQDIFGADEFALAFARIECHYFKNNIFTDSNNYILDNVSSIKHIPTFIVHGRYDVVCPVENAWELNEKLDQAHLSIIEAAGHSATEPSIARRLVGFMEHLKSMSS